MKADTLLDYAAFQLYPGQTRCELVVSGGGEAENLDPVLLEALIAHLPAARKLANEAVLVLKLELYENENVAQWFTKGTVERFIRFVSTPEVLERANAIQEEIAQLETARKFHLALYSQVDGDRLSSVGLETERSTAGAPIKLGTDTVVADPSSRSELLRALDVRLMTLHQELDRAFADATAADFLIEHMTDLLAFSEQFQAVRFRDACTKFLVSCQQRQQHNCILRKNTDAPFSGFGNPHDRQTFETLSKFPRKQDEKSNDNTVKESPMSQLYNNRQDEQESLFSPLMDNSCAKAPEFSTTETESNLLSSESNNMVSIAFEPPPSDKDNYSPAPTRRSLVRSSSPARPRRSASPMRRVQIGRCGSRRSNVSVIRSINYMPQWSNREKELNRESESSDTDNESGGDNEELELPSKVESARTISVQDAINLFERRQQEQRHSTEGLKKNIKVESRRLSAETETTTTYEKAVPRRWSGASEIGKLDVPDSTMQSLAIGKDTSQVETTPQRELKPIEEKKDAASRFSFAPEIMESQKMQGEQVQKIDFQHSDATRYLEKYRGRIFSADNGVQRRGPENTDNVSNSVRPEHESTEKFRTSHELNQLLQEKANQLEALFAAHKVRSQAPEEGSIVLCPANKDEVSLDLKGSDVNSVGPSTLEISYTGKPVEVSHRKNMFPGAETKLDQQLRTMQSFGKDSLSGSWSNSADFNVQTLMNLVDGNYYNYENQSGDLANNKFSDELRGKFYDQYREKREARLREENAAKRSEKEAKLKAMQEVLERRKAEMAGKSSKSFEKRDPSVQSQAQARKLQPSRARLYKNKKESHKTNEDNGVVANDLNECSFYQKSTTNKGFPGLIPSATSTPRVATDPSKSNGFRKISSKSMPPAIACSSSPLKSSSPRSAIPKISSNSNTSTGRRKSHSPVGGNPLARSMPNLADLKKDSRKTLSGHLSSNSTLDKGGAMSRGKNKGSGRNKSGNEAPCLDVNGSRSGSQSCHGKEEKKNRSQLRKGPISGNVFKPLPAIDSEESALISKPSFYNKMTKKSSVVPLESKPFLRKGNGIGPGIGRGISKTKASSLDDVAKTVEYDGHVGEENKKETIEESRNFEPSNIMEGAAEENEPDWSVNGAAKTGDANGDLDTSEQNIHSRTVLSKTDVPEDCVHQNDISDHGRNIPTVSKVSSTSVSPSKMESNSVTTNQEHSEEITLTSEITLNEDGVKPFPAAEFSVEPPYSTASAHYIPSGLNSELANSTSLKSHKLHSLSQMLAADTDEEQTRKKWGSAQKPILVPQYSQKDAPKGLKRLLKFGRKNRSETVTTDSISVSTFSEGDEDTEDLKESSKRNVNVLKRGQMQAKGIRPANTFSDRNDFQSTNSSVQSIQSAIFRDEHLTGAALLK
ncbi:hypothetical protein KI387_036808, partial [Taxus chinensis]